MYTLRNKHLQSSTTGGNLRICTLCGCKSIGDEFHYIMEYTHFCNDRKKFLFQRYCKKPNIIKFYELVNSNDVEILNPLSNF